MPFCKSKCFYCDFYSKTGCGELIPGYADAVCAEIESAAEKYRGYTADTVYFGGGTPTVLRPEDFGKILSSVRRAFGIIGDAEISTECNPGTVNAGYLQKLRSAGVNRLSIGVQSADAGELKALGRLHTFGDFADCVKWAREAGFDNISADVMYGIPGQTLGSYEKTLREVCGLGVDHLSAYCLRLEEGTPLWKRRDRISLPSDEEQLEMYRMTERILKEFSLFRYEISNFAAYGRESLHNIKYWNRDAYLGIGPAAHSFIGGQRFFNRADTGAYIRGEQISSERQAVSGKEAVEEYIMLRMRLEKGIDANEFSENFPGSPGIFELLDEKMKKYIDGGFVIRENGYRFTTEGFFVSNTVLSDVLDFEY